MLPNWFLDHIFCAGLPSEADGPCHGDSGGPLAKFADTTYPHFIQIGKYFIIFYVFCCYIFNQPKVLNSCT